LIEDYAEKLNIKAIKEVEKQRLVWRCFNEQEFVTTNPRVMEYKAREREILERLGRSLGNEDLEDVKALIEELEIACPESGSRNWTEVRQFNLMFGTKLGASADTAMDLYCVLKQLKDFCKLLKCAKSGRMKVPFGIAQTGKAFRNEIARQFIFRMREFEQMEMQFFVRPGDEIKHYEFWKRD
jgi:glycyl-tRNA synthetase